MMMRLILSGLPKSGKSSVGEMISTYLNWNFLDSDQFIESYFFETYGFFLTCREIYIQKGEKLFRQIEEEAIQNILKNTFCVIALGGGSLISQKTRKLIKNEKNIFYLKTSPHIIYERLLANTPPPYICVNHPKESFEKLLEQRLPYYEETATFTINADLHNIKDLSHHILNHWKRTYG